MKTRQRNPTLANLFLAIGAFALGLAAQVYFGGLSPLPTPVDGLVIYAIAAALFVVALVRTPRLPGLSLSSFPRGLELSPIQHGIALALALFSGAATVASLATFKRTESNLAWVLYLASIVLYLGAAYALMPWRTWHLWQHRKEGPDVGRSLELGQETRCDSRNVPLARWEWIALVLILAVALAFRLYRFTELPYGLWYDEADNGLAVRQIIADPHYRPVYVPQTNLPAHFLYLVALSFRILGDSMHAIRAVAVVFGLLTVVAAYLCGRELFGVAHGRYLGLVLAFLMAVSRWDVNWSRIGMHGVTLPFFELWVIAALLRGLRTGRLTAFAWAGVALGLGLCFYSPFRIFPAIVGGFALVWFWHWLVRAQFRRIFATWTVPILLVTWGTLVTVAPVAQFALRNPETFWDRARRISVFQDPNVQARPVAALWESTAKHVLMFNYRGDSNGRHNLPGAPMLDRLSGVLCVLGVLTCVAHWQQPRSVLLLLWLFLPLTGGILSTWFEAPQSLRSLGALPAVYALACLPMAWLAAEWGRVFPHSRETHAVHRFPKGPLATLAILLLLAIGLENGIVYFHFWASDFASWAAFNPAETHMSQDIQRYRDRYDLFFDPLLTAHLATRYLIPDYTTYRHYNPATALPIRNTDKEGVVLFISPETRALREQIRALYPEAGGEAFAHQSGNAVLYIYKIAREAIDAVKGLDGQYVLQEGQGEGFARTDPMVDFTWDPTPPLPYPFQVRWIGALLAPRYGTYALQVEVPGECYLALDGRPVMDGPGSQRREIGMAQGMHALYLDCRVVQAGPVRLAWQAPDGRTPNVRTAEPIPADALYRTAWPVNGLVGQFYANDNWEGEPALVRIDRQIAYYFHFLPLPRPYTVRWTGRLFTPVAGPYGFAVKAISSVSLAIDGRPVIQPTRPGELVDAEIEIASGLHDIELRYVDNQSHSQVYLYWQPPEGELTRVPFEVLFPPYDGTWWTVP